MQIGLAEIIGLTGIVFATGVGVFQIAIAYIQLRVSKNDLAKQRSLIGQVNALTILSYDENNKVMVEALINKAISNQIRGNLQEALFAIMQAKELSSKNLQVLKLEEQIRLELEKRYVNRMSGRIDERKIFLEQEIRLRSEENEEKAKHSKYKTEEYTKHKTKQLFKPDKPTLSKPDKAEFSPPITAKKSGSVLSVWSLLLKILLITSLLYVLLKMFGY